MPLIPVNVRPAYGESGGGPKRHCGDLLSVCIHLRAHPKLKLQQCRSSEIGLGALLLENLLDRPPIACEGAPASLCAPFFGLRRTPEAS